MSVKRLVLIPTYNENQNIEKLVFEILALKTGFDILVIDDNSPDGTAATVQRLLAGQKRLNLIKRQGKLGLGSAYVEGFHWAKDKGYDRVFTMDADFSHQPKYLPGLDNILENNDLAVGSRYVKGGGVEGWPVKRKLLSRLGNFYARTIIGLPVKDCTSGFTAISSALLAEFINSGMHSEGYSFLIELKNTAFIKNYPLKELPIVFIDRIAGVSKISKKIIFEAVFLALKLRLKGKNTSGRGNTLFKLADRWLGVPLVILSGLLAKKRKQPLDSPQNILVIKLSAMGDSILLIPALRALRQKYKDASISVLCTKINSAIFENCGYANKVIICDIKKAVSSPLSLFSMFQGGKYDIALDFDQWLRFSPLLAVLSGAGTRIGFKTDGQYRHYGYSSFTPHSREKHEIECFLELLSHLGINNPSSELEFNLTESSVINAKEVFTMISLDEARPFVVLHPETPQHGAQRHWPVEKYILLGKKLVDDYHFNVLLTGTKNEIDSNIKIAAAIGGAAKVFPPSDIMTVAATLAKAKVIVCGNTGIMHLACALHRPVVALHGPTNPVKWGPRGDKCRAVKSNMNCSPCLYLGFEYACGKNTCMAGITVEEVLKNVKEVAFSS